MARPRNNTLPTDKVLNPICIKCFGGDVMWAKHCTNLNCKVVKMIKPTKTILID